MGYGDLQRLDIGSGVHYQDSENFSDKLFWTDFDCTSARTDKYYVKYVICGCFKDACC